MFLLAVALYPLLLAALSAGLGLLVERASALRLPGALVPAVGFAALICVSQVGTQLELTAPLTGPAIILLAVAGFVVGRTRLRDARLGQALPALLVAAGLYLVYAAPVILTGNVAFTSYGVDTTPPIHWLGADQLASHGHDFGDIGRSTAAFISAGYFDFSYPSGGNTALGTTGHLIGVEIPWLFQPFLAVCGALLGLVLLTLIRELVPSRWITAGVAFIAAQPALLYAFYLQGMIKEVIAALCVPLLAATVIAYARSLPGSTRAVIPLAVTGAAGMGATGVGFAAWLGPAALLALIAAVRAYWPRERPRLLAAAGVFAVALPLLALTAVLGMGSYFRSISNLISNEVPLGSLIKPLSVMQTAGIWWSGDYRYPPAANNGANFALIGAVGLGAVLAAEWAVRRRAWPLIVYAAVAVPGCLVLAKQGTPWIDVKAMILASPLVLTLGLLGGVGALAASPARFAGLGLAAAIAIGVLISTAMMYHSTQLSPSARYRELARIDDRFAGQGPTLRPDFDDYAMYFTRDMDPDGPGDARPRRVAQFLGGAGASYGSILRLDQLAPAYVQQYPLLLVQRSAFESRPPATFRRVYEGKYYEVWKRGPGQVLEHLGAGSRWTPTGEVSCAAVRGMARAAERQHAKLAVSEAPEITIAQVADVPLPRGWGPTAPDPQVVGTQGRGRLRTTIVAPGDGVYDLWLAGSFTRPLHVLVDGREVAAPSDDIKYVGLAQEVARVRLSNGPHELVFDRPGGSLRPGDGASGAIGPVAITPAPDVHRVVRQLDPADYRQVCSRRVDWVEVVSGVPADGS